MQIATHASIGLILLSSDKMAERFLPQSVNLAKMFKDELDIWHGLKLDDLGERRTTNDLPILHDWVKTFCVTLSNELERLPVYVLSSKGNLSIQNLIDGASHGYAPFAHPLMDEFIKREIDEAGRCLACGRSTACGFHILRAVETAVKGYVVAARGTLPPMKKQKLGNLYRLVNECWRVSGTDRLFESAKSAQKSVDASLGSLEEHEAIAVFCICQSTMENLLQEIKNKSLEAEFSSALVSLPSL